MIEMVGLIFHWEPVELIDQIPYLNVPNKDKSDTMEDKQQFKY